MFMGILGNRYAQWDSGDSEDGFAIRSIDCRVFIYGVEVTEHLMSDLTISRVLRDGEGTCNFTLDNNYDKFVLRSQNFPGTVDWQETYLTDTWNTSKLALRKSATDGESMRFIGEGIKSDGGYFLYHENAKKELFLKKVAANSKLRGEYLNTDIPNLKYPDTYALNVGEVVIHRMDHLRVFILDPLMDTAEVASGDLKTARWLPAFTGFVDIVTKSMNQETGASALSVACVDVRNMLKRKRVLLNPDISVSASPNPHNDIAGIFSNVVRHATNGTATTNVFANMSFDKTIAFLICNIKDDQSKLVDIKPDMSVFINPGNFKQIPKEVARIRNKMSEGTASSGGFGRFAVGHVFEFMPDTNKKIGTANTITDWYTLTLFGVNRTWYTDADVERIGRETYRDGEFSALSGFVHFLFPKGGIGFNNVIDRVKFDELGIDREYKPMFEIITEMCDKIDYQIQVNGMGDIMIEFPMYDFLPEYVGNDYKYVYSLGNTLMESDVNDYSESNPITCLEVTGSYVDQTGDDAQTPASDDKIKQLEYTIYVKSDYLATTYGALIDNYDCPHLTQIGGANSEENKAKLAVFGVIEFTKRLASMSSMSVNGAYNPFLYPNRPLLNFYDRRVGLIESSEISLTMRQSATSSVTLKMIRRFDDEGKCALITGFENTPFSYLNPDQSLYSLFSQNGFGSYQDIRSKFGIEIFVADKSNVGVGNDGLSLYKSGAYHSSTPSTPEDIAAINELARKHGGTPKTYATMLFNESAMDPTAVNDKVFVSDTGKVYEPTYATGIFQIMPNTWDDLVKNRSVLAALGSPLPNPALGSLPKYGGKPNSKQAWSNSFRSAYPTVKDQMAVFDSYLTLMEYRAAKSNMVGIEKYRINDSAKLGIAQFKPSKLDNFIDSGGDRNTTAMTSIEQTQNPGFTNAADYGPHVEQARSSQADAWLNYVPPAKETPASKPVTSQFAVMPSNEDLVKGMPTSSQDRLTIGAGN